MAHAADVGCTRSGLHDGPQTVSWPQGESGHGLFLNELPSDPKGRQMDPMPWQALFAHNNQNFALPLLPFITPW